MRTFIRLGTAAALVALSSGTALARHHAHAKAPAGGPPPSRSTLAAYVAPFSWGMSFDQVKDLVAHQIEDSYQDRIAAQIDIYHQDTVKKQMYAEVDRFTKSYVEFNGGHSDWESSLVASEFVQNDHEALAVQWQPDQRKFFFFIDGKLWKVFIAFNSEKFPDKTFADFQKVLEAKFGSSAEKPVMTKDAAGKEQLTEYDWPPAGPYVLRGIDQTAFYGNFCLAIEDSTVAAIIKDRQAAANPPKSTSSFVDSVIQQPAPAQGTSSSGSGSGGDAAPQ